MKYRERIEKYKIILKQEKRKNRRKRKANNKQYGKRKQARKSG